MRARVKADARWLSITACAGREFTKTAWRLVPAGLEREAENNPFLETDADDLPEQAASPVITDDPVELPAPEPVEPLEVQPPAPKKVPAKPRTRRK